MSSFKQSTFLLIRPNGPSIKRVRNLSKCPPREKKVFFLQLVCNILIRCYCYKPAFVLHFVRYHRIGRLQSAESSGFQEKPRRIVRIGTKARERNEII